MAYQGHHPMYQFAVFIIFNISLISLALFVFSSRSFYKWTAGCLFVVGKFFLQKRMMYYHAAIVALSL